MIGRVVNALGQPIDDKGPIDTTETFPARAAGSRRHFTPAGTRAHDHGLKAIDSMIPIGRGQRELIIGDRQTGKTAVALDTIINNAKNNLICVYCAIGQKRSSIAQVVKTLASTARWTTRLLLPLPHPEPAPMLYIAPYAATRHGRIFPRQRQHALVIYDDLSKHATAYREISLLLRRPPGREAYPGDVFLSSLPSARALRENER